jgi:flagellar basal-body rod protein FlgG
MIRGLYTAASGMLPRIVQQETTANNLANVSTYGYKKSEVFLRALIDASSALDRALGRERSGGPEDLRVDYTQGTFDTTGLPFDFALNGPGFFRVRDTAGNEFYTRNGRFSRAPDGSLVNGSGMVLLDTQHTPVRADGESIAVMENGAVLVNGEQTVTIGVADFDAKGYEALKSLGMGLFRKPSSAAETAPSPDTQVLQGYLEDSNAEAVRLMVDMIEIFRTFEMGQKSIQIQDQTLQRVVTELGAVR